MFKIIITTLHVSDTTAVISQDINIGTECLITIRKKKKLCDLVLAGNLRGCIPHLKKASNEQLLIGPIYFI